MLAPTRCPHRRIAVVTSTPHRDRRPRPRPRQRQRPALLALLLALACGGLGGCATAEFYAKAAVGQASLMLARRDIQDVLDDPSTDADVAAKLRLVTSLLRYAEDEMGLPTGKRYRSYVEVKGPAVWMVVAAPEFSVSALPRCYPIIGCAVYRGYFAERDAQQEANRLAIHHDVLVMGSPAYSTLGWFDDPVLSSFIRYDAGALANLIFHELAHSVVYVRNDSAFNESFANFVGLEGAAQWLADNGGDVDAFRARVRTAKRFSRQLANWRDALSSLYRQPIGEAAKRQIKAEAFRAMRRCHQDNRDHFGPSRDDDMAALNNAVLALSAAYEGTAPAFAELFHQQDGDWRAFYRAVSELAAMAPARRQSTLKQLAASTRDADDAIPCSPQPP